VGAPAKGAGAEAFRCAAPGLCARALDGRLSVFPPACRATMARPVSARQRAQPAPPQSLQVWLAAHRSFLAACRINVAVRMWWRGRRRGDGSMSPTDECDLGRAAGEQRRAETQWFAVHDGMSSGQWDNQGNSLTSTVIPTPHRTSTGAHYLYGHSRTPKGRNGLCGRLPKCLSGADRETRCAYVAQRSQLTRASALSALQTSLHLPF
jgi:hypothetical protein